MNFHRKQQYKKMYTLIKKHRNHPPKLRPSHYYEGEIPNYTPRKITVLIQKELAKFSSLDALCIHYQVAPKIVSILLSTPKVYSVEMYDTAAAILNISFDEITSFTYRRISRKHLLAL
jgi:hypothetical protein